MSRLYLDVTELAGWQGKLTGVPRVMDEISKRYSVSGGVTLVTWEPAGYRPASYPFEKLATKHNPDNLAKKVVKRIHRKSALIRRAVTTSRRIQAKRQVRKDDNFVSMRKGDMLFVLADWHGGDPSFVKYLEDAHASGIKLIQMVYDLLPIVTPQYSGHSKDTLENYSKKIYPICDLMFSISEHTRKDVIKWLENNKLKVPPINVIRLGDDFSVAMPRKPKSITLPEKFLLCVGTIEARKNHTLLYYTYKRAKQNGIELPPIVIVGRVGWLAGDIYEIMRLDPEVKEKFIFMHHVDDNELAWLYQNCMFSVYPSFYEGWGLPIAESIAHGKPVIASNTSSMTEIAGELINYFSPTSPDECLAGIMGLAEEKARAEATSRIKQYEPYYWDKTFNVIEEAIKGII